MKLLSGNGFCVLPNGKEYMFNSKADNIVQDFIKIKNISSWRSPVITSISDDGGSGRNFGK